MTPASEDARVFGVHEQEILGRDMNKINRAILGLFHDKATDFCELRPKIAGLETQLGKSEWINAGSLAVKCCHESELARRKLLLGDP